MTSKPGTDKADKADIRRASEGATMDTADASATPRAVQQIQQSVRNFQDDMRAKEIHVGMPGRDRVVRCVTCGGVWPCTGSVSSSALEVFR